MTFFLLADIGICIVIIVALYRGMRSMQRERDHWFKQWDDTNVKLNDANSHIDVLLKHNGEQYETIAQMRSGLANLLSMARKEKRSDGLYSVLFTEELLRDIGVPISSHAPISGATPPAP